MRNTDDVNRDLTVIRELWLIHSCMNYSTPFRQKLINLCTLTLILVRHQSIFRATQNFFNQYNIYLYTTGTIFC